MMDVRVTKKWYQRIVPPFGLIESIYHLLLRIYCLVEETRNYMATNAERLDAIESKLTEAKDEIVAEIQALREAAANGEDLGARLSRIETLALGLADIVPDAPPVTEGEDTPPAAGEGDDTFEDPNAGTDLEGSTEP